MEQTPAPCPRCKAAVPAQASTCPACGAPLAGATSEPTLLRTQLKSPVSTPTQPQPPRADLASPQLGVAPGRRFGHYEVVKPIARGGMGMVFIAKDTKLDRLVALKILLAGDLAAAEEVKRFQREALAAARLRHPNIVPIHDVGEQDGWRYLAMELVDGKPLSEVLRTSRPSPEEAAELMAEVAEGVAHAHKNGVIHRDLKPANLLVDNEGNVRITDFGLAKIAKGAELTESGTTLGTPNYMPPEQAMGQLDQIDERSDVYSLGAILFDILAGRPPFVGQSSMETLMKVIQSTAPSARSINPKVPAELDTICTKALEKERAKRYPSAKAFADALRAFLTRSPQQAPPQVLRVRRRRRHRGKRWISLLCVVIAVLAVVAVQFLPEKKGSDVPKPPVAAEGGRWELKQQETFTQGFPKDWEVQGWTIQDGKLVGEAGAKATLRAPVRECAALEMDLALDKREPSRIEIQFVAGEADSSTIALSSSEGSLTLDVSPEENSPTRPSIPAASIPVQTLRIERTGLAFAASLNHAPLPYVGIASVGPFCAPLRVSFSLTKGKASIHQFRLFAPSPFYLGSAFRVAEWLQGKGLFEGAQKAYSSFLSEHPEGSLSDEARQATEVCAKMEALNGGPQEGASEPDTQVPGLLPGDPLRRLLGARLAHPPADRGPAWDAYAEVVASFGKGKFEKVIEGNTSFLRILAPQERGALVREATNREFDDMLNKGEHAPDLDSQFAADPVVQGERTREARSWWRPVVSHIEVLDLKALAFGGKFSDARTQLREALDIAAAGSDVRGRLRLVECQVARLQGRPDEALAALDEVLSDKGWIGAEAECLSAETRILQGDFKGASEAAQHARTMRGDDAAGGRIALLEAIARIELADAEGAKKAWEVAAKAARPALSKGVGEWIAGDAEAARKDLAAARDGALGKEPPFELTDFLLRKLK